MGRCIPSPDHLVVHASGLPRPLHHQCCAAEGPPLRVVCVHAQAGVRGGPPPAAGGSARSADAAGGSVIIGTVHLLLLVAVHALLMLYINNILYINFRLMFPILL